MTFKETGNGDLSDILVAKNIKCNNRGLTSLEGSPSIVIGNFDCSNNNLINLKYSPEKIEGYFSCSNNNLETLKDSPKEIQGNFYCYNNKKLKDIKQQIIENQIKANFYKTDEGNFSFEKIRKEFEEYGKYLLIKEKEQIKKEQLKQKQKSLLKSKKILNNNDFGLSL